MVAVNLPFLHDISRLIRGLAIRETAWRSFRPLCPWTISLIAYATLLPEIKAAGGTSIDLSPSKSLAIVLDAIAKGFKFPIIDDNSAVKIENCFDLIEAEKRKAEAAKITKKYTHKLNDPCENSDFDALMHLDTQKKAEIKACAKMALDLIARNNMDLLLGIELAPHLIEAEKQEAIIRAKLEETRLREERGRQARKIRGRDRNLSLIADQWEKDRKDERQKGFDDARRQMNERSDRRDSRRDDRGSSRRSDRDDRSSRRDDRGSSRRDDRDRSRRDDRDRSRRDDRDRSRRDDRDRSRRDDRDRDRRRR